MSTTPSAATVKQTLFTKIEQCQERLRELATELPNALDDLEQAEQQVRAGMLEIGQALLQAWSESASPRTSQPECRPCRQGMRHKGYVSGPLVTTLGVIRVRRPRYRCERCGRDCYPHDERLRFLGHGVSWPLAKVVGRLGAQLPFEQAQQNLREDYGVRLSKQTIEQVCERAGNAVLSEEDRQRENLSRRAPAARVAAMPDSEFSPEKAYVLADGTMIHTEGDWHEIRVASVASVDTQDELLFKQHRARFLSCQDFGWELLLLARRAGYHRAKVRAFLADGARWLWDLAATHFPDAVQILDWYHLMEHVHEAAAVLYGEGSAMATNWSAARETELWEGRVGQTLYVLEELHKQIRAQNRRETLRKLRQYLEHNRGRIDYPRYRALGLRIGSGQVEGACKTLVGGRCKQAGMRNWSRHGAEGVLRLRAALQTGHYHTLWDQRLKSAA